MTSYTHRLNLLNPERTWTVKPEGLAWEREGASGLIDYQAVDAILLKYAPSKLELRRVSMTLRIGRDSHEITNIHFKGPLQTERKSEEFEAFVWALNDAIQNAGHSVKCRAGRTVAGYLAMVVLSLILVLSVLAGVVLYMTDAISGDVGLRFGLVLVFLPILVRDLRVNYPRSYSPGELPQSILSLT